MPGSFRGKKACKAQGYFSETLQAEGVISRSGAVEVGYR